MAIITPTNLKEWLGVSSTDAVDDTNIATAVAAANDAVVQYCGRNFDKVEVTGVTPRRFRPRSPYTCDVDDFWTTSGLIIKGDPGLDGVFEQTWSTAMYSLEPLNGLKYGQPSPYETIRVTRTQWFVMWTQPTIEVTAAWGWAAIPDAVFQATLLVANRLFGRKDSRDGVIGGYSDMGPVRVSKYEDPDATRLLDPYTRAGKRVLIA